MFSVVVDKKRHAVLNSAAIISQLPPHFHLDNIAIMTVGLVGGFNQSPTLDVGRLHSVKRHLDSIEWWRLKAKVFIRKLGAHCDQTELSWAFNLKC